MFKVQKIVLIFSYEEELHVFMYIIKNIIIISRVETIQH